MNIRARRALSAAAALGFIACDGEQPPASSPEVERAPDGGVIAAADGGAISASDGGFVPGDTDSGTVPSGDGGGATNATSGCKALVRATNANVDGYAADNVTWYDAACTPRSTALVTANSGGSGFARTMTYEANGRTRRAVGTGASGAWNGFGYIVSHGAGAVTSAGAHPDSRAVFVGRHHAIHEFKLRINQKGPVDVTVHWFFATGRSHPIYAITYDARPAGQNVASGDSRSPYGDLSWDDAPGRDGNVDGVAWGDKYKFTTTGAGVVSLKSAWDYTAPNTIPYAMEWANKADAEMGLVQTQSFEDHPAGGDYGEGVLEAGCWKRTSASPGPNCTAGGNTMPQDWLWPFQLNQYELPFTGQSKRVAWGLSYGAVGQSEYPEFGRKMSAYPYSSYSVAIVLGTHTSKAVAGAVADIEAVYAARLTATRGSVATSGPGGVGRSDAVAYAHAGYDPVYGTWVLNADGNKVTAQLAAGASPLKNPVIRVVGYTAAGPASVRVGGAALAADSGYFASVDSASKVLWLTLNGTITGTTSVEIE